ncbi:MAG TPA: tetratricopeptide repeat protein [Vicinamibacterales bacterium]|nr:tetratricopeptide repeat protein [Vicinamibacterales bacterium]
MAENPRIEELRRRVQLDPASIAFAALAEEFRRMGRYEEAIETCRAGLQRHPAYLSARVTLGRALIETGEYDAARDELDTVLRSAPENLAAIRGLAQIHERLGHSTEMDPHLAAMMNAEVERVALAAATAAQTPAPPAPVERVAVPAPAPVAVPALDHPAAEETLDLDGPVELAGPDPATLAALARLERFLVAIDAARHL